MASVVALTLNAGKPHESGGTTRSNESIQQKNAENWQDYKERAYVIMYSDTLPLDKNIRKLVFSYIGLRQAFDSNNHFGLYRVREKSLNKFFERVLAASQAAVKSPEAPVIDQKSTCCSIM